MHKAQASPSFHCFLLSSDSSSPEPVQPRGRAASSLMYMEAHPFQLNASYHVCCLSVALPPRASLHPVDLGQ